MGVGFENEWRAPGYQGFKADDGVYKGGSNLGCRAWLYECRALCRQGFGVSGLGFLGGLAVKGFGLQVR